MYTALIVTATVAAAAMIVLGLRSQRVWLAAIGVATAALTAAVFWFLGWWGEYLWFDAIGYGQRFWTVVMARAAIAGAGAVGAVVLMVLLTWGIDRSEPIPRVASIAVGAYIGARWGITNWDAALLYLNRVATQTTDPILGRDVSFYLFVLPLYESLYGFVLSLVVVALIAWAAAIFVRFGQEGIRARNLDNQAWSKEGNSAWSFYLCAAFGLVVLAWGRYLDRFGLLYSTLGVVAGPGWTDVHVRLPVYTVMIVVLLAVAAFLVIPQLRRSLERLSSRLDLNPALVSMLPLIVSGIIVVVAWFLLLSVVPGLFQWLRVQPNEITVEAPYIEHNIEFTRRAFKLDAIEEREYPVAGQFNEQTVQNNQGIFDNVRLWDWRALDSVYQQFQEIRLYYEFQDVDVDRYVVDGQYRQVMIAAREMELSNLPAQSQTFVNQRFKYTHGQGVTLTTVSEFTPEGLPNLLVRDIPPKSVYAELEVARSEIYYGELTDTHVVVDTAEPEFDYPSGEQNVYTHYTGHGGVGLHNLWRRFLFGWKCDGTRLFLSSYPTDESQILFHRRIQERVRLLAPFLQFDDDPYIVLADGKLYWIIDAYTVSSDYPYSASLTHGPSAGYGSSRDLFLSRRQLRGVNYIRNSVKAVVDAYNGSVDFYVFEPNDPLIATWRKVFPGLFKDRSQMPESLATHIRYPADMLLTQGLVYAKYHMTDPTVFYNQEDLWVRATEKYYGQVQPVEPYYIMWEPAETDDLEFVLMLPFTPKNRQVLIGWIAGMCDPDNYGRLLAYKFPKEKRVLGTQQMETKIDQDSYLSGRLSLWDQRGSRVIRGNVLVIPVAETLLYVEPIYLQAETAAYPELRLVAIMHNDTLSYAPTFGEALEDLFGQSPTPSLPPDSTVEGPSRFSQWIRQANASFDRYLTALGERNFTEAADQLQQLANALERLSGTTAPAPVDSNDAPQGGPPTRVRPW